MKLDELQVGKLVEIHRNSFGIVSRITRDGPRSKVWIKLPGFDREVDYPPAQIQAEADEYGREWFERESATAFARERERGRVAELTPEEREQEYGERLDVLMRAEEELAEMEVHVRELRYAIEPVAELIRDEDRRRRRAGEPPLTEGRGQFPKLLV